MQINEQLDDGRWITVTLTPVVLDRPIQFHERHVGRTVATGWLEAGETVYVDTRPDAAQETVDREVGEPAGFRRIWTDEGPTQIKRADELALLRSARPADR